MKNFLFIFYLILFLDQPLLAEETSFKIKNFFDSSSGAMKEAQGFTINGDLITEVGNVPIKTEFIDLTPFYVIPGLIDSHNHLFILDKSYGQDFSGEIIKDYNTSSELRLLRAKEIGKSLLESGITSTRDLGNSGKYLDGDLKREIEKQNLLVPRLFFSGPGIASGHAQFKTLEKIEEVKKEYDIISRLSDIAPLIEEHLNHQVNLIKIFIDNDPGKGTMPVGLLCPLVELAHKKKLKVSAHATTAGSVAMAVNCGVDSIEHGYFIPDLILKKMAEKNIYLVPTDIPEDFHQRLNKLALTRKMAITQWKTPFYKNAMKERLLRASRLNVPLAFGSDMYLDTSTLALTQGQAVKQTLFSYRESGLTNKNILLMATRNAALLIGDNRLGKIEAGAYADFIVTRKNPLENLEALNDLVLVVSRGKIILNRLEKKP